MWGSGSIKPHLRRKCAPSAALKAMRTTVQKSFLNQRRKDAVFPGRAVTNEDMLAEDLAGKQRGE